MWSSGKIIEDPPWGLQMNPTKARFSELPSKYKQPNIYHIKKLSYIFSENTSIF